VYDWLTEKEYTEYLLGNEDDEYGGMTRKQNLVNKIGSCLIFQTWFHLHLVSVLNLTLCPSIISTVQ
jgi:hypothetical protein